MMKKILVDKSEAWWRRKDPNKTRTESSSKTLAPPPAHEPSRLPLPQQRRNFSGTCSASFFKRLSSASLRNPYNEYQQSSTPSHQNSSSRAPFGNCAFGASMPDLTQWPAFAPPPTDTFDTPYHDPDDMWIHHIPKFQRLGEMESMENQTRAVFEISVTLAEDPSLDQEFRTSRSPPPPSLISTTTASSRWSMEDDCEEGTFTALRPKPSQDRFSSYDAESPAPSPGAFTFFDSAEEEEDPAVERKRDPEAEAEDDADAENDEDPESEEEVLDAEEDLDIYHNTPQEMVDNDSDDYTTSDILSSRPSSTYSTYDQELFSDVSGSTLASIPMSDPDHTTSNGPSHPKKGQPEKAARILGLNRTSPILSFSYSSSASSSSSSSSQPPEHKQRRQPKTLADRIASSTKEAYRELVRIVDGSKRQSEESSVY